MFVIDRLLTGGLKFVLDKIAAAVDQELNDPAALREALLAAQMKAELGELSPEDFARIEADLMARLRELDERRGGGPIEFGQLASAEVSFGGEE